MIASRYTQLALSKERVSMADMVVKVQSCNTPQSFLWMAVIKHGRRQTGAAVILPRPLKAGGRAEATQAVQKAVGLSPPLASLPLLGATTICTVKGNA
jgi:hypothetical protein